MIEFITANWDTVITSIFAIIGIGGIVARFTPTPKDDTIFAFLYDIISAITPNDRKEKVEKVIDKVEDIVDSVSELKQGKDK